MEISDVTFLNDLYDLIAQTPQKKRALHSAKQALETLGKAYQQGDAAAQFLAMKQKFDPFFQENMTHEEPLQKQEVVKRFAKITSWIEAQPYLKSVNLNEILAGLFLNSQMEATDFKRTLQQLFLLHSMQQTAPLIEKILQHRELLRAIMEGHELPMPEMRKAIASFKSLSNFPQTVKDCVTILEQAVDNRILKEAFGRLQHMKSPQEVDQYLKEIQYAGKGPYSLELLRGVLANPHLEAALSLLTPQPSPFLAENRQLLLKFLNNRTLTKGEIAALAQAPEELLSPFSYKAQAGLKDLMKKDKVAKAFESVKGAKTVPKSDSLSKKVLEGMILNENLSAEQIAEPFSTDPSFQKFLEVNRGTLAKILKGEPLAEKELHTTSRMYRGLLDRSLLPERIKARLLLKEKVAVNAEAQAVLEGKAAQLNLQQLIRAMPDLLFMELPATLSLTTLAEAIFTAIEKEGPSTQAHHLLYNVAQLEIQRGNFATAFQIQSKIFPLASSHPLYNMDQAIQEGSARQVDPKTGAFFSNLDSSILKGGNLHATQRTIDGQLLNCFDFKIAHHARRELTVQLAGIVNHLQAFKEALPAGFCRDVKIQEANQEYVRYDSQTGQFTHDGAYRPAAAKATEILFEGLGKVIIGKTKSCGCLYNWVQVEMEPHLPAEKLQLMLSMMGLGPILGPMSEESQERMKIAQLYRAHYPSDATLLQEEKPFFELPVEELKRRIIQKHSLMGEVLNRDLPQMEKIEILPGKEIWGIPGYGDKMVEKGVWGAMVGLGFSVLAPQIAQWNKTKETIYKRLTEGFLSSEQRFQQGVFTPGASSEEDLAQGGGDQVFTRVVNQHLKKGPIQQYPYSGVAQILLDFKKLAKRVPYGYLFDQFGVKNPFHPCYQAYRDRSNLFQYAIQAQSQSNEMMLKNAVSPDHIVGIVVDSSWKREDLIRYLLERGVAKSEKGQITIFSRPAEEFIHVRSVDQPFTKEMWAA